MYASAVTRALLCFNAGVEIGQILFVLGVIGSLWIVKVGGRLHSSNVSENACSLAPAGSGLCHWLDRLVLDVPPNRILLDIKINIQVRVRTGANSDVTYGMYTNVNYVFNDRYSALLGYRLLDIDYDKSGFVFDAKLDAVMWTLKSECKT